MPPAQRNAFTAEMQAAGVDWRLTVYGGALHAFHHPPVDHPTVPGVGHHPQHAQRAWRDIVDLLAECLPVSEDLGGMTQVSTSELGTANALPSSAADHPGRRRGETYASTAAVPEGGRASLALPPEGGGAAPTVRGTFRSTGVTPRRRTGSAAGDQWSPPWKTQPTVAPLPMLTTPTPGSALPRTKPPAYPSSSAPRAPR